MKLDGKMQHHNGRNVLEGLNRFLTSYNRFSRISIIATPNPRRAEVKIALWSYPIILLWPENNARTAGAET